MYVIIACSAAFTTDLAKGHWVYQKDGKTNFIIFNTHIILNHFSAYNVFSGTRITNML